MFLTILPRTDDGIHRNSHLHTVLCYGKAGKQIRPLYGLRREISSINTAGGSTNGRLWFF